MLATPHLDPGLAGAGDPRQLLDPRTLLSSKTSAPAFQKAVNNRAPEAAALFDRATGFRGEDLEAAIYRTSRRRQALRVQLRDASVHSVGHNAEGNTSTARASTRQIEFTFVAEMREAALARFQSRTQQTGENLEGAARQSFVQASRAVSARFSISFRVSEAVLNGFASASGAGGSDGALHERLAAILDRMFKLADEALNEAFGFIQDFMQSGGDIGNRIQELYSHLEELDIEGLFGTSGSSQSPATVQHFAARSMEVQMEFEFAQAERIEVREGKVQQSDPIVLDLDEDGIELSSYQEGARFDIEGTGRQVQTAFVTGGDAFLVLDRNANGRIDSGRELFGDQHGAVNGFEELRKLDSNQDGVINAADSGFDALQLWKDNGNGDTEPGELIGLKEAGITSIGLDYINTNKRGAGGNTIAQVGMYRREDGSTGTAADAILNFMA